MAWSPRRYQVNGKVVIKNYTETGHVKSVPHLPKPKSWSTPKVAKPLKSAIYIAVASFEQRARAVQTKRANYRWMQMANQSIHTQPGTVALHSMVMNWSLVMIPLPDQRTKHRKTRLTAHRCWQNEISSPDRGEWQVSIYIELKNRVRANDC